ncbi:hypothetical protein F5884DRAFT_859375 [Xylogone sp. PMI_703]|nr:hypothetical protein F5884DRAFT_859375 [Xylogone sp. PMI_703]
MGSSLPYAADAESPLKPEELQVLRSQYEKEGEHVGVQTKFNYAWGLIKSNARHDQQEGVRLLSEIFRTSPERRRECLYYLALGNYKLGNYAEARRLSDILLDKEPANLQASSLRGLIDDKVTREGLMGVAILSGVAIAAGVVGGMIFKSVGRRNRALRTTGLAVSLGLTALVALQGIREARDARDSMDFTPQRPDGRRHLDASGPREVVYCYGCNNEWYNDEHGLICPSCNGEITEIVSPESDPRPGMESPNEHHDPPDLDQILHHDPWDSDVSDPEEPDIERHFTSRGPMYYRRTVHSPFGTGFAQQTRQRRAVPTQNEPDTIIRDLHNLIGNLVGPQQQPGQTGRSGPDQLFASEPQVRGGTFRFGGNGNGRGPTIIGGHYTISTGGLRPRDADAPQAGGPPVDDLATYAPPPNTSISPSGRRSIYVISITASPDQLARILGSIFGQMTPPPREEDGAEGQRGMPAGLQGLFASIFNPANAVHGDAVYSQEALDRIITTLMEQHPTSNAPGPASPSAIASLPKKKLDEEMLGPELKGECSVCMDDVFVGNEVVVLPCTHWFHEQCASMWLGEHNTCPICRKGLEEPTATPGSRRPSRTSPTHSGSQAEHGSRRMSRNEARLDYIRTRSGAAFSPAHDNSPPTSPHTQRDHRHSHRTHSVSPPNIPGSFVATNPFRRRDSEMSDVQRSESRRGYTSGSDNSRRSSQSGGNGSSGGGGGGGISSWFRRISGGGRRQD